MTSSASPHPTAPKKQTKRFFSPALLLAVLCGLGVLVFWARSPPGGPTGPVSPAVGKDAPQIDLVQLSASNQAEQLQVSVDGKVTLLHLWGTWCGPCRMEYPHLAEVTESLAGDPGFQFLPVSCESGSSETFDGLWQKTNDFFQRENIHSLALADPRGVTRQSLIERLGQNDLYYPTSVMIGRDGKIVGVWEGYSERGVSEIETMARDLLVPQ